MVQFRPKGRVPLPYSALGPSLLRKVAKVLELVLHVEHSTEASTWREVLPTPNAQVILGPLFLALEGRLHHPSLSSAASFFHFKLLVS